jgi:hypothetical protein
MKQADDQVFRTKEEVLRQGMFDRMKIENSMDFK